MESSSLGYLVNIYKIIFRYEELDIPVDEKIREELKDMCNLSEDIEEKGMKKGE